MKLILIDPRDRTISAEVPLGLAYIAAYVKRHAPAWEVSIIDNSIEGLSVEDLATKVSKMKADVIGISVYTHTYQIAKKLLECLQWKKSAKYYVLGGPHITICDRKVCQDIRSENVILMRGEGEITWAEFLNCISREKEYRDIDGITLYYQGNAIRNKDRMLIQNIDDIPFPMRELLDMEYYYNKTGYTHIITSRGCPHHCTFCSAATLWQNRYRVRGVESVITEVEEVIKKYNAKKIAFYDDDFTANRKRVIEICNQIKNRNLHFQWWCNGRVSDIDEELLDIMKDSGCCQIFFGIESIDPNVLKLIKKGTSPMMIKQAIIMTKKAGIRVTCSFIIGLPRETKEQIMRTIDFLAELEPDVIDFNFYKPYPGTELTESMKQYGMHCIYEDPWLVLSKAPSIMGAPVVESSFLSIKEQYEVYMYAARKLGLLKQHAKKSRE